MYYFGSDRGARTSLLDGVAPMIHLLHGPSPQKKSTLLLTAFFTALLLVLMNDDYGGREIFGKSLQCSKLDGVGPVDNRHFTD